MQKEIYVTVLAYRFSKDFWSNSDEGQSELLGELNAVFSDFRNRLINLHTYRSLRHDCDLILWFSSHEPSDLASFREALNRKFRNFGKPTYSMLSLYEHSPYLKAGEELDRSLQFPPLKFFIAYPMSKSPEWYLVDSKERKTIMGEHIALASSHPENKDIRSYTTHSYGIGDQEFVVMYETDSLAQWSHVTAKLRETRQRKWVTKEEPVFVGILSEPLVL